MRPPVSALIGLALIAPILIGLPLTGCAPSAQAATRSFPVPGFTRLRVEGPYDVRVHTGGHVSVNARGPQARIDRLVVEPRGDTLVVTTEKGWNWHMLGWKGNDAVVVDISVPTLVSAALAGSGDLHVDRIHGGDFSALLAGSGDLSIERLETNRLHANIAGSGDLSIAGHTDRADASVQGSGDLDAAGLTVGQLNIQLAGSGDVSFGATKSAHGSLVGSGDISIAGRAACQISKTGSGDIKCGD